MAENIYEMLWDCEYCGAKKLLGQTHRFCPACGAPQKPEKRYFPAEADKVLAKDHAYFGADRTCPHCKNAISAKMKFCAKCGGAMEGAGQVKLAGETAPAPAAPAAPSSASRWIKALAVLVIAGIAGSLALRSCTKAVVLTVAGHSWERALDVERFEPVSESSWCDSLPAAAYSVSRHREVRSHRDVPDGQDCRTVKKDRGDGTYSESEECKTRYRQEPVYSDKCRYRVDRWHEARTERKAGASLNEEPAWPEVRLREGSCLGCERIGKRREAYTVRLAGGGKEHSCEFSDERKWRAFAPGSRWSGQARLTGGLVCEKLAAAP